MPIQNLDNSGTLYGLGNITVIKPDGKTRFPFTGGSLTDAPIDGSTYGRLNGTWSIVSSGGIVTPTTDYTNNFLLMGG